MYRDWEDFYENNPEEKPDPESEFDRDPIYLCHRCTKFDGDHCFHYGEMRLSMFGRKKACKHFSEWKWGGED